MRRRFRRIVVLGVTGAVIAAGAGTAYAMMSSSGPDYRLATATSAHVSATLSAVGTLTPVRDANVAFPIAGSVATVAVKTGQHVTVGQTLGSLDTTSLQAKVTAAQSTLASANAKVNSDIASQDAATATPTATPAASSTASSTAKSSSAALLSAQRKADAALQQADMALGQVQKACTHSSVTPTPTATPIATPTSRTSSTVSPPTTAPSVTATPTTRITGSPGPTGTPSGPTGTSCAAAEQQLLNAETAVMKAQQALSGQVTKLAKTLTSSSTAHSGTGGSSGSGGSAGSGGSGTATAVSAAQLAADQASAAAAAAEVTAAEQNLAAATVVSPVNGTVVTVSVTKGSSTGAGNTAFVVAGLDSYEVVTAVSVTDIPKVKVGQQASVEPDGMHTPLSGSVVSIGLVPTTSGSSTTYPVTVGLVGSETGLHAGGNASVTITTSRSSGVSVPTSAVHSLGRFTTVTVYAGGKTQVTQVTVGTTGAVLTQVTSGLKVGQQVVLADLSQPLPTNNLPGRFAGRGPGLARGLGG